MLSALLTAAAAQAEVKLPAIFSDHMVLQASEAVPLWGWAAPGEKVSVTLDGKSASAVPGADGRWQVELNLKGCAAGPFDVVVAGKNSVTIRDVVIGEVWLASGQSNMAALLKSTTAAEQEIASSSDALLREFYVEGSSREGSKGKWVVSGPKTSADFSAVAYYFAKSLRREIGRPVGIINTARSGTPIEAWLSQSAMAGEPELAAGSKALKAAKAAYPDQIAAYRRALADWLKTNRREDPGGPDPAAFASPEVSTRDWAAIGLPGKIEGPGLPAAGVVWLRKEIEILPAFTHETIKLLLGVLSGFDTVYWNGEKIAETPPHKFPGANYQRYYVVPPALIKPGKAVIAIRVFAPARVPAFESPSQRFWVGPIRLEGNWSAKAELAWPSPSAAMLASLPSPPKQVSGSTGSELFESIIAPIAPFRLAGFLWYQGESNNGRAAQYRKTFPLLINDWRRHWSEPELPFYFCQLANHLPKKTAPDESTWAELREAQSMALRLPRTGQVVLIDIGEAGDIHPRNKKNAGERLARVALAGSYGKNIVSSGPVHDSTKIEGKTIRVTFRHAEGGLIARSLPTRYDVKTVAGETAPLIRNSPDSEVEGFAICGADRKWVWANAKIEEDSVIVCSDQIESPIAVRYAWADNPTCNLDNGAGLPASPFRTDDFPTSTKDSVFGSNP